jgi:hypothetical protein
MLMCMANQMCMGQAHQIRLPLSALPRVRPPKCAWLPVTSRQNGHEDRRPCRERDGSNDVGPEKDYRAFLLTDVKQLRHGS